MRLKYPNVGSNRGCIFEERFTDPLHVQHNQGTVNLVGAATLPLDHGATFPTIASGLTAYLTYPSTVARISACSAMTVVFDISLLAYTGASAWIFQKYDNASNEWCVSQVSTGQLRGRCKKNGVAYSFTTNDPVPLDRVQFGMVWNGATILPYLNGSAVGYIGGGAIVQDTDGRFYIGGVTSPIRSVILHHTRIWNRALSAADVAALYAGRDPVL